MARIAGVDLPSEKRLDIALTAIYGIGRQNVVRILENAHVSASKRAKDLVAKEISSLQKAVDKLPVEGTLRKKIAEDVKRLGVIGSYRGLRHASGLPSRGQRTRSNARTKRGARKTVGAMKKDVRSKLESGEKERGKGKDGS